MGRQQLAFGVRDLPRDVVERVARHRPLATAVARRLLGARRERTGRADPRRLPRRRRRAVAGAVVSSRARGALPRRVPAGGALAGESADSAPSLQPDPVRAYLEVADRGAPSQPTRVSRVYPSTSEIPENLLRFYVHFTAPMSRGDALRWVRLEDSTGASIEQAFLALEDELWDPRATRLTLLLDPGRIKSGLRPRAELGRALAQGREVTLVIDARWPDASGRPLGEGFRRAFRVVAADQATPDPAYWRLEPPRAGGRKPLRIALGEPLDSALLQRLVWVEDAAGRTARRLDRARRGRTVLELHASSAVERGPATVVIDRRLEDLAGNRVGRRVRAGPHARGSEDRNANSGAAEEEEEWRGGRGRAAPPALDRRSRDSTAGRRHGATDLKSRWPGASACGPTGPSRAAPPCCGRRGGTRTGTGSPPREDRECAPGSRAGS